MINTMIFSLKRIAAKNRVIYGADQDVGSAPFVSSYVFSSASPKVYSFFKPSGYFKSVSKSKAVTPF